MKVANASILHKALLAVAVILLPVIVTFALSYHKNRLYLNKHILDDLTVMAEAFEGQVYQFLEMNRRRAKDFASDRFIREAAGRILSGEASLAGPLSDYISRNKLQLDKKITRVCVISPGGRVIASTDPERIGSDVSGEPFFQRAEAGIDVTERAEGGRAPEIAVLTELLEPATGRTIAWLASFTHLSGMGDVLSGRYNRELGALSWSKGKRKTMEVYLVNRDRLMITESLFVEDAVLRQRVDTLPVSECLGKSAEVSAFYADYRGVEVAGASMCFPLMGWTLLAEVEASEILGPLVDMRRSAFAGAVVVAGLIGALLAAFYRMVVVRLRLISRAAAAIAGGDYDISLPIESGDEIGALSVSFNAMARDVRDRTMRLREGEEKYRTLVSNIPDVIWTATPEGGIEFISPNAREMFGYSLEQMTSDKTIWVRSIHPDDAARVLASYGALFRENRSFNEEYRLKRKDGRWIWVHDRATAAYERDGQRYADGVISDITERRGAEEREARLNRLYSVLTKINEAIVRIRDIPRLYAEAARIAVYDGRFMMAWVAVLDDDGKTITPAACSGEGAAYLEGLVIHVSGGGACMGPTATAVLEGRLVVSNDIENDGRMAPWRDKALRFGFRSSACLPLFKGGKAVGAISLYSAEVDFFNGEELKLLESLAADISFAVESIENERLGRQSDRELHLLQGLSLAIRDARDFPSALDAVITGLCSATGWSLGEAWLPSKDGSALEYARSCGCSGAQGCNRFIEESRKITFRPGEGVPGRVWRSRKPLWITDIAGHEKIFLRAALAREAGLKAQFGIPIIEGDEVLAVVVFLMAEAREEDKRLVDFVSAASAQLGPVLRSKLVEEARQELQQRYEGLVNNLSIGVFRDSQGANGHIVEANPAALAILDAPSKEELLRRRMSDFYADDGKRKELAARMFEQGAISNEELELVTFSGRRLWGSLTAVMKEGAAGERYFDGIIEDITERKRLEDQLRHAQKMEAVGQLAGGIAHDFNNILTALIGYANLLVMKKGEDELVRSYADHMLNLSEKASSLTQGLLAFSRRQVINTQPVDLNSLITRVEKIFFRLIGEDIELRTALSGEDITVRADPAQLEHVLMNLATNARDAMPGGGAINIGTGVAELDASFVESRGYGSPGRYARITFADTGAGIAPENIKRIFEPFFTTKEVGKGTGLGLSMVYGIIKQHNGYIEAESEPGKGTVFSIYLPLGTGTEEPAGRGERAVKGGTETILLAEDQEDVRVITKTMLEEFGYEVIDASDGEDAVRKYAENRDRVALAVLDMIMPKKSGKEAFDEIRRISPHAKALFTSGYASDVMKVKGVEGPGVGFISKPVSPSDFLMKVREVLDE